MVLAINSEGATQLYEGMPPILPFNSPLDSWVLGNRSFATVGQEVVVTLTGSFAGSAQGVFTLAFDASARLTTNYTFTWTAAGETDARQVGVVFGVPAELSYLSWRRSTPWSTVYPSDHIGRAQGDLVFNNAGPPPANVSRSGSWCNDPYPLGDADFRSTKHNVTVFELSDATRSAALAFVSNANQHGRAWVSPGDGIQFLAADLSNEGGNPFSREAVLPHRKFKSGDVFAGSAVIQMGSALV